MTENLRALSKFRDSLSFIYLEHAVIEREDRSVAAFTAEGRVGIPAASLGVVLLGPGTRITHAAIGALADCGCSVVWVGEDTTRFYAAGMGKSRSSANLERQALAWATSASRMGVVRRLYAQRFSERLDDRLTLQQIRGKEGARVRDAYQLASSTYGVPWDGRRYERNNWAAATPVNRALSAANSALYGICHAAIVVAGFSPALGFIHTGKQLSFVYDVADLYKVEFVIPAAFAAARDHTEAPERAARILLRQRAHEGHLLRRAIADLDALFGIEQMVEAEITVDAPAPLWDDSGPVEGGVNHADDLG